MELFSSPLTSVFSNFLSSIEHTCVVCSPYVGREPVRQLVSAVEQEQIEQHLELLVVTGISLKTLLQGATDRDALAELQTAIVSTRIVYLPRVHAKVYLADKRMAIVGSANFTAGGISRNFEYVACIYASQQVQRIRTDIEAYANLGGIVTPRQLATIREIAGSLRQSVDEEQRSISEKMRRASEKIRRETEDDLIRVRIGGTSINAIFSRTIEYLLRREPLTTKQLHERIRGIHPDLCDDTMDRVIDGVRYGKLWKHQVRTAQQHLKRANRIALDEASGTWQSLADEDEAPR
jgi:phosphatidylserine/phosphatidylglycerophosphate/cardiolipin synthase-like enzyme